MGSRKFKPALSPKLAGDIKRALWHGATQSYLASLFGMSQAAISHIVRGISHYNVQWPDGSYGPMPQYRDPNIDYSKQKNKNVNEADEHPPSIPSKFEGNLEEKAEDTLPTPKVGVIDPELEEKIWEAIKESQEKEEEDLLSQITSVSSSEGETAERKSQLRLPTVPWNRIKRTIGTTPLYFYIEKNLKGDQQELARRIVCEVCGGLPARYWTSLEALEKILNEFIKHGIEIEL